MADTCCFPVIGVIHSPFTALENMPIQPAGAAEVEGEVVVEEQWAEGLRDLEGFSHIYLLYPFHQTERTELLVTPFLDKEPRGVFATRSPLRPAHLGLSLVRLRSVAGNRLRIQGVDILDGTPLLDIKPYVPGFDVHPEATSGWMQASGEDISAQRSDDRFV
jgi:tRNA-Thr(GGU) m(6)t(6)A37 methyltransferase TsaA